MIISYRTDFVTEPIAGNDLGDTLASVYFDQEGFDSWDNSTAKSPS